MTPRLIRNCTPTERQQVRKSISNAREMENPVSTFAPNGGEPRLLVARESRRVSPFWGCKSATPQCPLMAEAVEELYFSLGQNNYSHLSDIHSNRYEGIAKYLKSLSGSSYEPRWRQRNALFKMTAFGRKMSIFKIRSYSTASAKSGRCGSA